MTGDVAGYIMHSRTKVKRCGYLYVVYACCIVAIFGDLIRCLYEGRIFSRIIEDDLAEATYVDVTGLDDFLKSIGGLLTVAFDGLKEGDYVVDIKNLLPIRFIGKVGNMTVRDSYIHFSKLYFINDLVCFLKGGNVLFISFF